VEGGDWSELAQNSDGGAVGTRMKKSHFDPVHLGLGRYRKTKFTLILQFCEFRIIIENQLLRQDWARIFKKLDTQTLKMFKKRLPALHYFIKP